MKKTLLLALAFLAFGAPAFAVNLVNNGGFETGDFTGWTQSGDLSFTGVDGSGWAAHTGIYGAYLGPIDGAGFITQTLATTAGDSYDLSFYLRNLDEGNDNAFGIWWGGNEVGVWNDLDPFDWEQGTFSGLVASGASTDLTFGFYNPPSYFHLDDIVVESSVAPVPEPASLLLLGVGLAANAVVMQRRRRATVQA